MLSTGYNLLKILGSDLLFLIVCITWGVEFIRGKFFFILFFYVWLTLPIRSNVRFFQCLTLSGTWSLCCTCWWYSLCHLEYWSNYTNTCSYNLGCWIYTSNFFHNFLVCLTDITNTIKCSLFSMFDFIRCVKSVFITHVGGTRGVPFQYRHQCEQTCSDHLDCCMYTKPVFLYVYCMWKYKDE